MAFTLFNLSSLLREHLSDITILNQSDIELDKQLLYSYFIMPPFKYRQYQTIFERHGFSLCSEQQLELIKLEQIRIIMGDFYLSFYKDQNMVNQEIIDDITNLPLQDLYYRFLTDQNFAYTLLDNYAILNFQEGSTKRFKKLLAIQGSKEEKTLLEVNPLSFLDFLDLEQKKIYQKN